MEADVVGEQKVGPIAALPDGHVANRVLRTVQLAVLIVSVAAAIPTARNLIIPGQRAFLSLRCHTGLPNKISG